MHRSAKTPFVCYKKWFFSGSPLEIAFDISLVKKPALYGLRCFCFKEHVQSIQIIQISKIWNSFNSFSNFVLNFLLSNVLLSNVLQYNAFVLYSTFVRLKIHFVKIWQPCFYKLLILETFLAENKSMQEGLLGFLKQTGFLTRFFKWDLPLVS